MNNYRKYVDFFIYFKIELQKQNKSTKSLKQFDNFITNLFIFHEKYNKLYYNL